MTERHLIRLKEVYKVGGSGGMGDTDFFLSVFSSCLAVVLLSVSWKFLSLIL